MSTLEYILCQQQDARVPVLTAFCKPLCLNTFNMTRDLGDLKVWLLNFTSSVNHINYLKKINIEINFREMNDSK